MEMLAQSQLPLKGECCCESFTARIATGGYRESSGIHKLYTASTHQEFANGISRQRVMVSEVKLDQSTSGQPEEICPNDYLRLSEILIAALPQVRKLMWGGKVMAYLARQTTQAVSAGQGLPDIPTKSIQLDLGGNPNQEPSQWLSPIWKEIETRHYPEIEPTLIELSRQAGLKVYPALQKLSGKPALYRLATKALPVGSPVASTSDTDLPPNMILYKRDLSLSLSWLGNIFFSRGLSWTPFKQFSF